MNDTKSETPNCTDRFDTLKLDRQICFPLYACGKEITRLYQPILAELDLTYTQYIAMMVLWEEDTVTLKHLGKRLFLDSGTLTPLVKKLESKGFVERKKDPTDDRNLLVSVTKEGYALRETALAVPEKIVGCVSLPEEEAKTLYSLLYKVLGLLTEG